MPARDLSEREADALASMMGADSRRIDDLVGDVGTIKGSVVALKEGVSEMKDGINELRGAMTILSRHSIALERSAEDHSKTTAELARMDTRIRAVELDMPGIKETREDVRKVQWLVWAAVVVAVVGLVLVSKR